MAEVQSEWNPHNWKNGIATIQQTVAVGVRLYNFVVDCYTGQFSLRASRMEISETSTGSHDLPLNWIIDII